MRQQRWFNLVGVVSVLAVLAVGALLLVAPPTTPHSTAGAAASSVPTAYRNLSIVYNAATGGYDYSTRDLSVPAGVTVVFTITNFDPSTGTLPTAAASMVTGTRDGATLGAPGSGAAHVSSIAPGAVSHTFSMSNGFYHLNVPIPPALSAAQPSVVSFSVVFSTPGTFDWGCVILCGTPMAGMPDPMFGLVTVG